MAINSTDIPNRIKFFRKLRSMTQEELSRSSGINFSLIRKYESGHLTPKLDQIQIIASGLGISLNTFLDSDISTVGDVMGLLIKLDEAGVIQFSGQKKKDGSYRPSSIGVSISNSELRSALSGYMSFKDKISDPDTFLTDEDSGLQIQIEKTRFMLDDSSL